MFKGHPHEAAWAMCLDLAIAGFNAGSLGIAAVVLDQENRIVSWGRNHLNDPDSKGECLSLNSLAHAEVNAILMLGASSMTAKGMTLLSTVEPCPMCTGAIAMSRIRDIVVASVDPYAGGTSILSENDYLRNKIFRVQFEKDSVERLFAGIHYISLKRHLAKDPSGRVMTAFKSRYLELSQTIDQVVGESVGDFKLSPSVIEQWLS